MKIQKIIVFVFAIAIFFSCENSEENNHLFYIGGYTSPQFEANGDGICICSMDGNTGEMSLISTQQITDPSYLVVHPSKKYLYAATESGGENPGMVTAFKIDETTGALETINRVNSGGGYPCHMSFSNDGRFLLVANYGDGVVATIPVKEDGGLSEVAGRSKHYGQGPFKVRQEGPHAHYFGTAINDSSAFAVDLGIDKVIHYRLSANGALDSLSATEVMSGTGPRHLAFHSNNKWCYVLSEFTNKIEAFNVISENEPFNLFQVIGTTSYDMPFYTSVASAIKIHPNGKFLYAANRGKPTGDENSISVFKIDGNSGKLELLGTIDTKGKVPRDFEIDPTGNYIVAANQFSENVVSFKINLETGMLEDTGHEMEIKSGTCVKFL